MKTSNLKNRKGLISACTVLSETMEADKIDFEVKNIDAAERSSFAELISEVSSVPQDSVVRTEIKYLTRKSEENRTALHFAIRQAQYLAKAFGSDDSVILSSLETKYLSKDSNIELMNHAEAFIQVLNEYSEKLPSLGLSDADVTDLSEKLANMRSSYAAQQSAIQEREVATQERLEKWEDLYRRFTKYCFIGKSIWSGVNPVKLNRYNITIK